MSDNTKIEWADTTWNPLRGCTRVSEGCRNCYAERLMARNLPDLRSPTTGEPFAVMKPSGPTWTGRVELIESKMSEPFRWRKPRRVFVNSISDTFHERVSDDTIERIFRVMIQNHRHRFIALTKRADRVERLLCTQVWWSGSFRAILDHIALGISAENQEAYNSRVEPLLWPIGGIKTISAEPLLGPIDLRIETGVSYSYPWAISYKLAIRWVIVGGESGPGARPCRVEWVRSIVEQCRAAGVACFVKQLGSHWAKENGASDGKGANMAEWPEDLRVRQVPAELEVA